MKYQCPNCSFAIFNRRIKKCESCGTPLPPELLYTNEQIASIDAEFERNKSRLAQLRRNLGLGGGADGGSTGGGDGCGGDGGGDCG